MKRDLLEKAKSAVPPQCQRATKYAKFRPVVTQLMSNGFKLGSAVTWLIDNKEILKSRRSSAYQAFAQWLNRDGRSLRGGNIKPSKKKGSEL